MQIPVSERSGVLDELLELIPRGQRASARKTANKLADLYEGQDANVIGVLWRAAQRGKFDEYTRKLHDYYNTDGKNVPVNVRSLPAGQNPAILETLLKKEEQIAAGTRDPKDRSYHPRVLQNIMRHPEAIRMELFFLKCYQDMGVRPGED